MYRITKRETFSPVTYLWEIEAPDVAKAAKPGQFIMVRAREGGERIPLTIADFDAAKGTVTCVIQALGKTTTEMMKLQEGDSLKDFIGPLGIPSHIVKRPGKVVYVGGGLGVAPVYPQLRASHEAGNHTVSIIGFRNKDLIFWEDRFKKYSTELHVCTDDGSYGTKGFVTVVLKEYLERNKDVSEVVAIGPLVMMKACADVTREFNVPTIVSLNTIMVDGIGMCGSCRITVGGKVKFACVDGPDFDAHQVDWNEVMNRQKRFKRVEDESKARYEESCKAIDAAKARGDVK